MTFIRKLYKKPQMQHDIDQYLDSIIDILEQYDNKYLVESRRFCKKCKEKFTISKFLSIYKNICYCIERKYQYPSEFNINNYIEIKKKLNCIISLMDLRIELKEIDPEFIERYLLLDEFRWCNIVRKEWKNALEKTKRNQLFENVIGNLITPKI